MPFLARSRVRRALLHRRATVGLDKDRLHNSAHSACAQFTTIQKLKIPNPEEAQNFPRASLGSSPAETAPNRPFGGPPARLRSKPCVRHPALGDRDGYLPSVRTSKRLFIFAIVILIIFTNMEGSVWTIEVQIRSPNAVLQQLVDHMDEKK
jgi:hypothetical protein